MFDQEKKENALNALASMCHHCGENHTDECLLAKAIYAVNLIPTQE